MADVVNPKRAAVALGTFLAVVHLVWALAVAANVVQGMVDLVLRLHFISMPITILPFNIATAIGLVVFTFIYGAVLGYLIAYFWNWAKKTK